MAKSKLEYIWLDGSEPTQQLRSKTKIIKDFSGKLEDCPIWSFDGSSTNQAPGGSSDCLLKPVAIFPDPERKNGYFVMTEVLSADGTGDELPLQFLWIKTSKLISLRLGGFPIFIFYI